jgi:hypothetical protein
LEQIELLAKKIMKNSSIKFQTVRQAVRQAHGPEQSRRTHRPEPSRRANTNDRNSKFKTAKVKRDIQFCSIRIEAQPYIVKIVHDAKFIP